MEVRETYFWRVMFICCFHPVAYFLLHSFPDFETAKSTTSLVPVHLQFLISSVRPSKKIENVKMRNPAGPVDSIISICSGFLLLGISKSFPYYCILVIPYRRSLSHVNSIQM